MSIVPSNPTGNVLQGGLPLVGDLLGGGGGLPLVGGLLGGLQGSPAHQGIRTLRHIRTSLPSVSLLELLG